MSLRLCGIAGVVALALSGSAAMACTCINTPPFSEVAIKGDLVIVGVVLSYQQNAMQVQVDRVLKGVEGRKTITVWGDDGTRCRPSVTNFPLTTKWIFTLFRSGEKLALPPAAVGPPFYELSSCGRYWLQVRGNEATGRINGEEDETVPLFDVIRWLVEGSKAPLGRRSEPQSARREPTDRPVVFVCEHGNVKSLIGASLFNRIAKERGLPFHAVARGVTPEAAVPPKIVDALHEDGVEVEGFKPERLSPQDVSTAYRTIAIGVDLSAFSTDAHGPMERWDDVPPASVDYAASRAALTRHINLLLDELVIKR